MKATGINLTIPVVRCTDGSTVVETVDRCADGAGARPGWDVVPPAAHPRAERQRLAGEVRAVSLASR